MADKKTVRVTNRSNSMVVYSIPELGVRREFTPREVKTIPVSELEALTYRPGGTYLIQNNLFIADEPTVEAMPIHVEPEYYLDDAGVIKLLNNTNNLDEFLDALDFAPAGVIDLIKKYAVELPVNDSRKREAIKKKLGFDVNLALLHIQQAKEAEEADGVEETETPVRRVQPKKESTTGRRTTPKYKVVTKEE